MLTDPLEVREQGELEVPVELDDLVTNDVLQAAPTAELPHEGRTLRVHVATDERVHVLVPQFSYLEVS